MCVSMCECVCVRACVCVGGDGIDRGRGGFTQVLHNAVGILNASLTPHTGNGGVNIYRPCTEHYVDMGSIGLHSREGNQIKSTREFFSWSLFLYETVNFPTIDVSAWPPQA